MIERCWFYRNNGIYTGGEFNIFFQIFHDYITDRNCHISPIHKSSYRTYIYITSNNTINKPRASIIIYIIRHHNYPFTSSHCSFMAIVHVAVQKWMGHYPPKIAAAGRPGEAWAGPVCCMIHIRRGLVSTAAFHAMGQSLACNSISYNIPLGNNNSNITMWQGYKHEWPNTIRSCGPANP